MRMNSALVRSVCTFLSFDPKPETGHALGFPPAEPKHHDTVATSGLIIAPRMASFLQDAIGPTFEATTARNILKSKA